MSSENENLNKKKEEKNYFLTTIKNTSVFVGISLLTKVLNLLINIFVIRKISKQTFGIAKIYFETAYLMLQYFPFETLRKTSQKYCCTSDKEKENIEDERLKECTKLSWLINILIVFITIPYWYIYVNFGENLYEHRFQMGLHLLCANIELFVEPITLYCNVKFFNNEKLLMITVGNYVRVFSTFILVIFFDLELWAFTFARIFSSLVYVILALHIGYNKLKLDNSIIFPFFLKEKNKNENIFNFFNPILKEIFMSFVFINILKMILTYTEKIFLGFFIHFHETEKSEYSFVIDNFAILIRFFLEPLESNFFNFINKIKFQNDEKSDFDANKKEEISKEIKMNKQKTVKKLLNILNLFLKFLLIFGCLLVGYIHSIGKEVFMLVFGKSWVTETSVILVKRYSIYIFIISINGIIEAFGNATSTGRQMKIFNKMMIFNSIFLITFSFLFKGFSVLGLIYANGLAMILRIIGNIYIIFKEKDEIKIEKESKIFINFIIGSANNDNSLENDLEILTNISENDNKENKFFKIAKLFNNSLFRLRTLSSIILCVAIVFKISEYEIFQDNNIRYYYIVNNNFMKVLFSGLVFLLNVLIIFLSERNDFKKIYNEAK